MKKTILTIVITALLTSGASATDWTLMVFLNADNNLHDAGLDDINEMEWCTDNNEVNIIVLFDGQYGGDSVLYKIWNDDGVYDSTIRSIVLDDGGAVIPGNDECDMDDPQQLEDFLVWAQANYPADNYLLSLWDHGSGIFRNGKPTPAHDIFKGVCGDLKLWEVEDVLNQVAPINIVGFDVCLLGQIETGYQLRAPGTDYVIGSMMNEPGDGWDYQAFEIVCANSNTTPAALTTQIVDDYLDFYSSTVTQGGQDLTYLENTLVPSLNAFADELRTACYANESNISAARNSAFSSNTDTKDLYEFATAIKNDSGLPGSLRNAATTFCNNWANFIIAGGLHHAEDPHGGASVFFPTNGDNNGNWGRYTSDLTFHETRWDEFLLMYADPYPLLPNYFTFVSADVDDTTGGDGDGVAEPGETVDISATVRNDGTDTANSVNGTIATSNSYVTINTGTADFGSIPAGGTGTGTFNVTIDGGCPEPEAVAFDLAMTSSTKYSQDLNFGITVGWGFNDDVESGLEDMYTAGPQWHVEDYRSHSPDHSWKCGGNGAGDYGDGMNSSLVTPAINVPTDDPELAFWTWYDIEDGYDYGYVEISTNGTNWTTLNGSGYDGTSDWTEETFDLNSYAGETVYVRFRLDTDGSVTEEGWYVDDISVETGSGSGTDDNAPPSKPYVFNLFAAYPNPTTDIVNFGFTIPEARHVTIDIYDIKGRKVETVIDETFVEGEHSIGYEHSLSAGIYLYRLQADSDIAVKKMVVVR
ncbi:MAG: T9SS type A sorting domain-containing protein [bacterium]|nr:T9SS type A sorting domain-containing protein [bacterium]